MPFSGIAIYMHDIDQFQSRERKVRSHFTVVLLYKTWLGNKFDAVELRVIVQCVESVAANVHSLLPEADVSAGI